MTYSGGFVNFTITIAVKDNRYKYTISNLYHEGTGSKMPSGGSLENNQVQTWTSKQWNTMKFETDTQIRKMIFALKLEMSKTTSKNDDW